MHEILANQGKRTELGSSSLDDEEKLSDERHLRGYENEQSLPLVVKLADSSRKSKRSISSNTTNVYQDGTGGGNRFSYNASIPGTSQDTVINILYNEDINN